MVSYQNWVRPLYPLKLRNFLENIGRELSEVMRTYPCNIPSMNQLTKDRLGPFLANPTQRKLVSSILTPVTTYPNLLLSIKNYLSAYVTFFTKKHSSKKQRSKNAMFKKVEVNKDYLTNIKNVVVCKNVTKFRLFNHKLIIEVGRHQKVPTNEGYCLTSYSIVQHTDFNFRHTKH